MGYDWNFGVLTNPGYLTALAKGLLVTFELSVICIVIGTPLGILIGSLPAIVQGVFPAGMAAGTGGRSDTIARRAAHGVIQLIMFMFVDVLRAIPLLLLMFTCYYGLPYLLAAFAGSGGTHTVQVSAFAAAAVAMSINLAAFVADLVRGAFAGVPRGSILAGLAIGMNKGLVIRRIILPEVLREIWPALVLLYITMLKMSTLASALTVWDVLHSAEAIIQTSYRTLELYLAVCTLFVILIVPLSIAARRLEQSEALRRRS
jgi:ABC-type amino acid transport system permease subunit